MSDLRQGKARVIRRCKTIGAECRMAVMSKKKDRRLGSRQRIIPGAPILLPKNGRFFRFEGYKGNRQRSRSAR